MHGSIDKVFTMRASSLGDALMGKYFLENIRAAHPEAHYFILVGSRGAMIRDLLAAYPWLEVIEASRRNPASIFRAWKKLYDADLALTQPAENNFSLPSKLFARLVAKKLVGFKDGSRWNFLYDSIVPFTGEERSEGMIVEEQKALRAAGIPIGIADLRLSYVDDTGISSRFNLDEKGFVLLHLFSGDEGRSISQEKRIDIVRALRAVLPQTLVLTGGGADSARAQEAIQGLPDAINLAGKTSIQELVNLIAGARATLSLDTGAAHIAAHLQVPLVVMSRKEARTAWWGNAMYQGRPTVLCNEQADDRMQKNSPHPPSLETIDLREIVARVTHHVRNSGNF